MATISEEVTTYLQDEDKIRFDPVKLIKFYDENAWRYDRMMDGTGYKVMPDFCANLWKEVLGNDTKEILDIGCGAGKTGASLKKCGFQNIDGVDPSVNCLKITKESGIYRNIFEGKITDTEKLNCIADGSYDGVFSVGSISAGHIKLENALPEFIRVLKSGGVAVYLVCNTLDQITALEQHIPFLKNKSIELLRIERKNYFTSKEDSVFGNVYVIRKF